MFDLRLGQTAAKWIHAVCMEVLCCVLQTGVSWCRMRAAALSFTQVDPAVLSELPQEVQDELTVLLPSSTRGLAGTRASHPRTEQRHAAAFDLPRHRNTYGAREPGPGDNGQALPVAEPRNPLADECAQDLWQALHQALQQLAKEHQQDGVPHRNTCGSDSSCPEDHQGSETAMKLDALQEVVTQWAAAHVRHDLEAVHCLLRRLSAFKTRVDAVQQAAVSLIQLVQQQVQQAHGATLHMRPLLL